MKKERAWSAASRQAASGAGVLEPDTASGSRAMHQPRRCELLGHTSTLAEGTMQMAGQRPGGEVPAQMIRGHERYRSILVHLPKPRTRKWADAGQ